MIVKTIGSSGQISLGKEYAGRTVVIETPEEGVWLIRTAQVIPDNEQWLYEEHEQKKLKEGLNWAKHTPAKTSDVNTFETELREAWEQKHGESLD